MEIACSHASEIVGTPYSFDFNNSDDSLYCSELVLKVYARTCGWTGRVIRNRVNSSIYVMENYQSFRPVHDQNAWEVVFQAN